MRTSAFRLAIYVAAAIMLALASQASAQDVSSGAAVGRTRAAKIIATLPNTFSSGVCTAPSTPADFSMECPSGNCGCYKFSGTITGDLVNKGTAAFLLNVDLGLPAAPTTSTNGANTCSPVFGTIVTNTTTGRRHSTPLVTTFNVVGGLCMPLTNRNGGSLNGGYGVLNQTGGSSALTGYGALTGTVNPRGTLLLNMKGPAS